MHKPDRRRRNFWLVGALSALTATTVWAANESVTRGDLPKDVVTDSGILLRFEQADFSQVIDLYGRITEKVIVPSPEFKGKMTILNRGRVNNTMAARLIESALELQGWTVIPEGSVVKVVKTKDAVKRMIPTVVDPGARSALSTVNRLQTHVVTVHYGKAEDAKNFISPLLSNEGTIQVDARTNTMVITEVGTNMARLMKLLSNMDRPLNTTEKHVASIIVHFVDPKKIIADIKEYFKESTVTFLPNERLQLIVVSGRRSEVEEAERIITQLDKPLDPRHSENQVIPIQFAKAPEIAELVSKLYKGRIDAPPPSFSVNADKASNTLIITGPPELRAEITSLVSQIDQRYDQVLLKVLIGELRLTPTRTLGIEWQALGNAATYGDDFSTVGPGTTNAPLVRAARRDAIQGFKYSIVRPNGYNQFIYALETSDDFNVMASPQITVANNKTATFTVGDRVPVITSNRVSDNSNTQVQTNEYVDTGIILKCTPAITPGREVSLDLDFKFSEQTRANPTFTNPTFSNRQTQTTVIVKDVHTLVIGGLLRADHARFESRFPFLGRLPAIGPLFRNRSDNSRKQELLILLTPTILSNPKEEDAVTHAYQNYTYKDTHKAVRQNFQKVMYYQECLSNHPKEALSPEEPPAELSEDSAVDSLPAPIGPPPPPPPAACDPAVLGVELVRDARDDAPPDVGPPLAPSPAPSPAAKAPAPAPSPVAPAPAPAPSPVAKAPAPDPSKPRSSLSATPVAKAQKEPEESKGGIRRPASIQAILDKMRSHKPVFDDRG